MDRKLISATGILDEAAEVVSRTSRPWLGVLWLSGVPLRLAQVYLVSETCALGSDSRAYGDYLGRLSLVTMAAFMLSLYGRAVYVRACRRALQSRLPSEPTTKITEHTEKDRRSGLPSFPALSVSSVAKATLRVPFRQLAVYAYTALLIEALFFLMLLTVVAVPFLILFAGLAAATAHSVERPGPVQPLRVILRGALGVPPGLMLVFGAALLIAWLNLFFAMHAALWLASGVAGWDVSSWLAGLRHLLRPVHPFLPFVPAELLPGLLILAGAVLAVEPFWLASLTVYVFRSKARETGEDLRRWFAALQGGRK